MTTVAEWAARSGWRLDALSTGRLDYAFSTLDQFGMTSTCETLGKTMGSDHVPVVMTVRY